jgi:hypothetical protein
VQDTIIALQDPLQIELTEGVANFNDEVLEFDRDYDAKGPMVDGIAAKEASDRVSFRFFSFVIQTNPKYWPLGAFVPRPFR